MQAAHHNASKWEREKNEKENAWMKGEKYPEQVMHLLMEHFHQIQ